MTARPVHVVVVAYGRPDLLDRALAGLAGVFPVRVVDNSSSPQVRAVADRHSAHYTDPGRNGGFGAGVNVALSALSGGEPADVLLLNPDALIEPSGVRRLGQAFDLDGGHRLGMVTPSIVDEAGVRQRSMWPFPHPGRAWLEAIGLGRLNRARDFAVGTVLLLRWEALQQVGLFDERFFLYAEETDWQRRARSAGWLADEVTAVTARHLGGATSADPGRREQLFHAGTETYLRKWFGSFGWQVYRAAVVVGAVARVVVLRDGARTGAAGRARLYVQGPRRAAGLGAT